MFLLTKLFSPPLKTWPFGVIVFSLHETCILIVRLGYFKNGADFHASDDYASYLNKIRTCSDRTDPVTQLGT